MKLFYFLFSGLFLISYFGCKDEAAVKNDPQTQAQVVEKLKAADLSDGTEDKIVSKCTMCGLSMDGTAEYSVEYNGYHVHLCSETCKHNFEKNPQKAMLELKIN